MSTDTRFQVSSYLWFADGNIVLQAGSAIFRVYRGLLMAKSAVFQGMGSLPQPSTIRSEEEEIDGCPLVVMKDDPAELEHFLRALFDPEFMTDCYPTASVQVILGILRVSTKYCVAYLQKRCAVDLDRVYPTSLRIW
ncbi:hypothetical protein B0H10DRAFT_1774887, partial [Mycena sp. CBHHK59/15]